MAFSTDERNALLSLKGVGNTVIARLEEMGFESRQQLSQSNTQNILEFGTNLSHSTCWKNSPQARAAIDETIQLAKSQA